MKYCGIELKGNDAILVGIETTGNGYKLVDSETKKIGLKDSNNQSDVKLFTKQLYAFLEVMAFDKIAIKERGKKGKFAGGPTSFKIEGIIQNSNYPVSIIHGATIRARLKDVKLDTTNINKYQAEALNVAVSMIKTK